MKTILKYAMALAILMVLAPGCSSDDSMNPTDTSIKQVEDRVKLGTWKVSNYNDSGKDETVDYTGYEFTFGDNGVLTATKGSTTINGTWSVTQDGSDDDSSNDIDFNIAFSAPEEFAELTDDWDIVSTSSVRIELMDVSGGNGTTDRLIFERN